MRRRSHAAEAAALWVVQAHAIEAFDISPRLEVSSPEPGCGKTLFLDVLEVLVPRGLRTENLTSAVMFRVMDAYQPTLLIDEADSYLRDNEELRGALNAGHRKGGRHMRCEGDGNEVRAFNTFGAAALAGIDRVPATLVDRSITILLRKRLKSESVERFRASRVARLVALRRQAARWASDNLKALGEADPDMPEWIFNRQADNWRPLFAIADHSGGDWSARVRDLASVLTKARGDDTESIRVQLLKDVQSIFKTVGVAKIFSTDLAERLAGLDDRPWGEWGRQAKPITKNRVAALLRSFGVSAQTIRIGHETKRGYEISAFDDAFSRYTPSQNATTTQANESVAYSRNQNATTDPNVAFSKPPEPAESLSCGDVAFQNPPPGGEGMPDDQETFDL